MPYPCSSIQKLTTAARPLSADQAAALLLPFAKPLFQTIASGSFLDEPIRSAVVDVSASRYLH